MIPHWRYVLDNLFGEVRSVSCLATTHVERRVDERGQEYACTAEDAAYATFLLDGDVICHVNSSWATRVRRDDLAVFQVDGTHGICRGRTARLCGAARRTTTPRPIWNPDIRQEIDFYAGWQHVPDNRTYDNAFKVQWELFLKHVVRGDPFPWTLLAGAKGVQLAERAAQSWRERRWVDIEPLS